MFKKIIFADNIVIDQHLKNFCVHLLTVFLKFSIIKASTFSIRSIAVYTVHWYREGRDKLTSLFNNIEI